MNKNKFADYILSHMENAKLVSGGREINCRCKECGDSMNKKSAHLYISIPTKNKPALFNCFKCNSRGVLTYKKLIEWDIYDPEFATELQLHNSTISSNPNTSKYLSRSIYKLNHNFTNQDNTSELKRIYICNRLGRELSYQDLSQLKIILNLLDLLKENNINVYTRDINIINDLDREFIGFLSIDNAFLNMRKVGNGAVYKSIDKRYVNYKIFDKFDNSQRFYTIPTIVNLNSPFRIPLHIAEGPFDILSVYLNLRNKQEGIYTSISGNNYLGLILTFLIDMQLPNIELHLYTDNDKYGSIERMTSIANRLPDPTIPVFIHKNTFPGEKDFGVPLSNINESIIRIK